MQLPQDGWRLAEASASLSMPYKDGTPSAARGTHWSIHSPRRDNASRGEIHAVNGLHALGEHVAEPKVHLHKRLCRLGQRFPPWNTHRHGPEWGETCWGTGFWQSRRRLGQRGRPRGVPNEASSGARTYLRLGRPSHQSRSGLRQKSSHPAGSIPGERGDSLLAYRLSGAGRRNFLEPALIRDGACDVSWRPAPRRGQPEQRERVRKLSSNDLFYETSI